MFSFYYAMFANLTPPVALASFAAAGLSGGDPMKTGVASVKLAIAGFIVPFMFVFSPQLMLINTTLAEGAWTAVTACIGVFMLAVAVEGYFCAKVAAWLRLVILVGALGLMNPGMVTDAVGIACCVVLFFIQKKKEKALKAA